MGEPNKDRESRARGKTWKKEIDELISELLENDSHRTTRLYDDKADIVKVARNKLKELLSVRNKFKLLMEAITGQNTISDDNVRKAFQLIKLVLESKHTVPNQYQANEIGNQKLLQLEGQETNVESHFQGDTVRNQGWPNESSVHFLNSSSFEGQVTNVESHFPPEKYEGGLWDSDKLDNLGILNALNKEQNGMIVEMLGHVESHYPANTVLSQGRNESYRHLPSSSAFKGQDTNVGSPFPGGLEQAISVPEMPKYDGGPWDLDKLDNLGILSALNNAQNSMIVEMIDQIEVARVKDYAVFKPNDTVLAEIFHKHPDIDEKFQLKHPKFQRFIMMSLAEVYQKIGNKVDMPDLKDIPDMEVMVQDMEFTGLKLPWLKEMLEEVSKMLKDKADTAEMKRLREEIDSDEAELNKKKEKLAKLKKGKKPVFE